MSNGSTHLGDQHASEEMMSALEDMLKKMKFKPRHIAYSPGTDSGGNFLGLIAKAEIEGDDESDPATGGVARELTLVLKCAPRGKAFRSFVRINEVFAREAFVYERVFPELVRLQEAAGIFRPFAPIPKFYYSITEPNREVLVMEDMRLHGFACGDRRQPLDMDHMEFIMRDIGKMHALSFALRDQEPQIFEEISKGMRDVYFNQPHDSEVHGTIRFMNSRAIHCLDPIKHEEAYGKFRKYLDNMTEIALEAVRPEGAGKYAVITHGDFWANNLLYKYKNSKLTEICMLDWQMSRFGSPALDLAYFLFLCADGHTLDKHYEHLMRTYHNSLSTFLHELGSDADVLFPYDALLEQMRCFSVYGLYMGTWVLSVLTSEADEIPDMENMDKCESIMKMFQYEKRSCDKFYKRIRPVILHMVKHRQL